MLWKPNRAILFSVKYDFRFRDWSVNLDFKLLLEVELLFNRELLLEVKLLIRSWIIIVIIIISRISIRSRITFWSRITVRCWITNLIARSQILRNLSKYYIRCRITTRSWITIRSRVIIKSRIIISLYIERWLSYYNLPIFSQIKKKQWLMKISNNYILLNSQWTCSFFYSLASLKFVNSALSYIYH